MSQPRWSGEAPQLGTARAKAMVAGTFLTAGGVPGVYLGASTHSFADPRFDVVVANAVTSLASGLLVLLLGHRFPDWVFHVLNACGTALITVGIVASPWPDLAVAFAGLYLFIAVDAFFLFPVRAAVRHLVAVVGWGSLALSTRPDVGMPAVMTFAVVVVAVSWVVRRLVVRAASASLDSLTGLPNAAGLADALEGAVADAARTGAPLSVAILDADHFHAYNRAHGQAAGDVLLRSIAADLSRALPDGALLSRRAGDEFAVLLPGTGAGQALLVAEALCARVGGNLSGGVTLSGGVAEMLPRERGAELVRRAEATVREAKTAGRARCLVSSDAESGLARDLALAIEADQIAVVFQPVVRVADGAFVGVEALARWTHPDRGAVSPADFIPAAESARLIVELGACVLGRACRDAHQLRAAWGPDTLLTVNVSGRELTEPGYADAVARVLATTGWPAANLVLEITESMVEGNFPVAVATMARLREFGIAIAIDDFGTGYSSFARLDTVPADYLKLDHSFISTITTSPRRAGVLQGLLALSQSLDLTVIAEGVENPEQAALLGDLACPLAQGYLFSRPAPVAALLALAAAPVPAPREPEQREPEPAFTSSPARSVPPAPSR